MQNFTLGTRLCFGDHALDALQTLDASRVLLVTDAFFAQNGLAAEIAARCNAETRIFSEVQPDPPLSLVAKGVAVMQEFQPDVLLALGGGSPIDCAKGMLSMSGSTARLVAIPTTSGTGSEVTSFAILTHERTKHPLVDAHLRPKLAILDPSLLQELPPKLIADAGMDVAAHCLEAIAAKSASPFSDALATAAFQTVLRELPKSYHGEKEVRGAMHCAATMAGIAFDNAGLGACHALSHAIGGTFHTAHGRLNGILLPHVVHFNAVTSPQPYARLAAQCGLSGVQGLCFAIQRLRRQLSLPATLTQAGLERSAVLSELDALAEAAYHDPCTQGNPRPVTKEDYVNLIRGAL